MLATGQVALALVLLTAAGLLLRSFVALVTFDLGFDPHNVVIARAADPARINMFPRGGGRLDPEQIEAMNADERRTTETLLLQMERVTSLPGVEAVALASVMPFGEIGARPITVAGQPAPTDPREQTAGRDTNRQSRLRRRRPAPVAGPAASSPIATPTAAPRVAVVSESFARGGLRRRARGRAAPGPAGLPVSGCATRRRRPRCADLGSHRRGG